MSPDSILSWTLFGGMIIGIVLAFAAIYFGVATWLAPRLKRVGTGQSPKRNTRKYCCPAGLGCNDEDTTWQQCRRTVAKERANTAEFLDLERTWSAFCAATVPTAKRRTLGEYEVVRDGIITRMTEEVLDGGGKRKQLLAGTPEQVEGEITADETSANGSQSRVRATDY